MYKFSIMASDKSFKKTQPGELKTISSYAK